VLCGLDLLNIVPRLYSCSFCRAAKCKQRVTTDGRIFGMDGDGNDARGVRGLAWGLWQALKKQKEQEEKLALEKAKRDKERDKADRDRIKAKLEQVKAPWTRLCATYAS
jgi:hypothetical protein